MKYVWYDICLSTFLLKVICFQILVYLFFDFFTIYYNFFTKYKKLKYLTFLNEKNNILVFL